MIADGAHRFREPRLLERVARQLGRLPLGGRLRHDLKRLYLQALSSQTRGRGLVATLPEGERVQVSPESAYLCWNPDEYRAFRDAVRPGDVALDVGANAGAYTLLLGQWVGASGSVFAFEPSPDVFARLVRHIRLNGLDEVVCAVPAAVGEHDGEGRLDVSGSLGEARIAREESPIGCSHVPVEILTLDTFCERQKIVPRFIKIDVEGWELSVLRGARRTIQSAGQDLQLFVEFHPSVWPSLGVSRASLETEFAAQNLVLVPSTSHDPWTMEGICVRLAPR